MDTQTYHLDVVILLKILIANLQGNMEQLEGRINS